MFDSTIRDIFVEMFAHLIVHYRMRAERMQKAQIEKEGAGKERENQERKRYSRKSFHDHCGSH